MTDSTQEPHTDRLPVWHRRLMIPAILAVGVLAVVALSRIPKHGYAFVSYPPEELARVKSPHAYKGKPVCQLCHSKVTRALLAEPTALCTETCHTPSRDHHPVNVVQAEPDKAGLPLIDDQVVCHSCHDPHDVAARKAGLRLPHDELCLRCHSAAFVAERAGSAQAPTTPALSASSAE